LLVVFVSGAFWAGRRMAVPQETRSFTGETTPGPDVTSAEEIPWHITARDLL